MFELFENIKDFTEDTLFDIRFEADYQLNKIKKKYIETELDEKLKMSIEEYADEYDRFLTYKESFLSTKEKVVQLITDIEDVINSIANHPKEYDKTIGSIERDKSSFKDCLEFEKENIQNSREAFLSLTVGVFSGAVLAEAAPPLLIKVAKTYGKTLQGKPIANLKGVAADNAAKALIGRIFRAKTGQRIKTGNTILASTANIGWVITVITTIMSASSLYANSRRQNKEKISELELVIEELESLKQLEATLVSTLEKMNEYYIRLERFFETCKQYEGKEFLSLDEEDYLKLEKLLIDTAFLSKMLSERIE